MDDYIAQDQDGDDDAEGPRHMYYASEKLLGKLYRAIDERRIWIRDIKRAASDGAHFWEGLRDVFQQQADILGGIRWQHRKENAERIRHA